MTYRILLIEPASSSAELGLGRGLPFGDGYRFERVRWETLHFSTFQTCQKEAIVAFAVPPVPESIAAFAWLRSHPIGTPIFSFLPHEVDPEILQLVFGTSDEFMFWPMRLDEFRHRLKRILGGDGDEVKSVHNRLTEAIGLDQLVGTDPAFRAVVEAIPVIAKSDVPVLITGETGTGKEVCARAIHHLSRRRSFPFIAVDCGAIPDHLLENEMFGHSRGAFTDARTDQRGLIAMGNGGTLFLDEVDSLSLGSQVKLLRFLQDHTYRPLGADKFFRADVNVIAATNGDLAACVRAKQFRPDLYFRLNVLHLELPPLRDRSGDIELLARHFLHAMCTPERPKRKTLLPASLHKLRSYDWPGNVRELLNALQRAVLFAEGPCIRPSDLPVPDITPPDGEPSGSFRKARQEAICLFERRYVAGLLDKHGGNVTRAAREAGQDRRAFGRLKKKYHIDC